MHTTVIPQHPAPAQAIPEAKRERLAHELAAALAVPALPRNWWSQQPTGALPQPGTEGCGTAPGMIAALRYRERPYVLTSAEQLGPGQYVLYEINPVDRSGNPYDSSGRPAIWHRTLTGEHGNLALQAASHLRERHKEPSLPHEPDRRFRVLILDPRARAHATYETHHDAIGTAAAAAIAGRYTTRSTFHLAPHALRGAEIERAAGGFVPVLFTICPGNHSPRVMEAEANAAATSLLEHHAVPRPGSLHPGAGSNIFDAAALVLPLDSDIEAIAALADRAPSDWPHDRALTGGLIRLDF